ncbi:MAG: hypothetical protein VB934_17250, partial [Polyangiaceae bacterium]
RHPAWWSALLLLLLNDHLLKGAGLLPTWFTGKLSDFAGLIVAPVLLCAIVGARGPLVRLACFGSVSFVFAAQNLSQHAAGWLVDLVGLFGLRWSIVTDPSDLLGLAALPLAWWLAHRPDAESSRARPMIERLLALAGALACVATSAPPPSPWSTNAFLSNQTNSTVDVRLSTWHGNLDCATLAQHRARALAPDGFGTSVTIRLAPGRTVPFIGDATPRNTTDESSGFHTPSGPCKTVLIQADGMQPTLIVWGTDGPMPPVNIPDTVPPAEHEMVAERLIGRVDILGSGSDVHAVSHGEVEVMLAQSDVDPADCTGESELYAWSQREDEGGLDFPPAAGSVNQVWTYYTLDNVTTLSDGCLSLDLSSTLGVPLGKPLSLCVPAEAFPFQAGEPLEVARYHTAIRLENTKFSLTIQRNVSRIGVGLGVPINTSGPHVLSCNGERHSCGAFTLPVEFDLDTQDGVQTVGAGDDVVMSPQARMFLGRAEWVGSSHHECLLTGRAELGFVFDYALLVTKETP